MKTAIYQYWDGDRSVGSAAGAHAMRVYADRIGAKYFYELNAKFVTNLGKYSPHYGAFKPVFDPSFDQYDYILVADTDVWPVEHLEENIFDQFINTDIDVGICEEWAQPEIRKKFNIGGINAGNDKRWLHWVESYYGITLPVTEDGDLKILNSGVVVYSKAARRKMKQMYTPFQKYVNLVTNIGLPAFYTSDQTYLHAMLEVCKMNWMTMDYKWNSSVFYTPSTSGPNRPVIDLRSNPNFVHIQLNSKHAMDADRLWRVTNLPVEEWNL